MTDDIDPRIDKLLLYPTKINIEEKLDSVLRNMTENDFILFFFSGHGISDYDENGYLLTVDTKKDRAHYTSLKVEDIAEKFKKKNIKKALMVLDACRETVYTSKSAIKNSLKEKQFNEAELSAIFYSTKSGFYSYEDDMSSYGVFTKYLIYGMEGKADSNKDGVVTFSEIEIYVQEAVKNWSMNRNEKQKPYTKITKEKFGELALTRASNPSQSVADIPLKQALTRMEYSLHSSVIPGWGQWQSGGKIRGSLYLLIMAGIIGNFGSQYSTFNAAQRRYNNVPFIPFTLYENAFFLNYYNSNRARKNLDRAEDNMFNAGYAIAGFWLFNIIDAYIFGGTSEDKKTSLYFDVYPAIHSSLHSNIWTKDKTGSNYNFWIETRF